MAAEEGWEGKEVARARSAVGYKGEDFGDKTLLDAGFLAFVLVIVLLRMESTDELGVEFCQPWLACVVEDEDCVYHFFWSWVEVQICDL